MPPGSCWARLLSSHAPPLRSAAATFGYAVTRVDKMRGKFNTAEMHDKFYAAGILYRGNPTKRERGGEARVKYSPRRASHDYSPILRHLVLYYTRVYDARFTRRKYRHVF